jgi:hypothetical protein
MVFVRSIGNMFDHSALEDRSSFDALADQPGQIDGSINTDRRKFLGVVNSWGQLLARDWFELSALLGYVYWCLLFSKVLTYTRHNVFVPGVRLGQF